MLGINTLVLVTPPTKLDTKSELKDGRQFDDQKKPQAKRFFIPYIERQSITVTNKCKIIYHKL